MRYLAVRAIEMMSSVAQAAVPRLKIAGRDPDPMVQSAAKRVLEAITPALGKNDTK